MNIMDPSRLGVPRAIPNHTLSMAGKKRVCIQQKGYGTTFYSLSDLIVESETASPARRAVLLRALEFLKGHK